MTAPTRRDAAVATPNEATTTRPERSSARVARKAPLGWLPWLLLGLLALLLALTLLVVNAVDDDGADGPAGDSLGQAGVSDGSGADGEDGESGSTGAAGGSTGSAGALTAGGQDLLALSGSGLGSLAGQAATGQVRVQSVVADEGFWAGTSASDRVFVFLTPEARRSSGESGFQVREGQTVTVEGVVRRSDAGFAERAGVTTDEGAQQLVDAGGYVEATKVALAQ